MKVRFFCFYAERAQVVGRVCFIGAFVEVSAERRFECFNSKNLGRNFNRHCPVDGIILNAWRFPGTLDFLDIIERERLSVIATGSAGGEHEASACCFEIKVFCGVCGVLQKDFDAGIFPAVSVVILNGGAVAIYRFFDGELDDDAVRRLRKLGSDHRVDDSLVGRPFHIRF